MALLAYLVHEGADAVMSFLAPLFLAGAAAAAVPLVLHLLKRQPEPRVKFAAVKLLKHAPVELTEKRRLRELLLLALRMAALALLARRLRAAVLRLGRRGPDRPAPPSSRSTGRPACRRRGRWTRRSASRRTRSRTRRPATWSASSRSPTRPTFW